MTVAVNQNMQAALESFKDKTLAEIKADLANAETSPEELEQVLDPATFLPEAEEVSVNEEKFEKDTITQADWDVLVKECKQCIAFSAVNCGLEKVEVPTKDVENIEVLDLSQNKFTDLSFLEKFPKLVSLTLREIPITKMAELEALKNVAGLKVIEFAEEQYKQMGFENDDSFRKACFEMKPDLLAVNGLNLEGKEMDDLFGEEEEDFLFDGEEECSDEDDEAAEAVPESPTGDEEEEPAAKKQKTE